MRSIQRRSFSAIVAALLTLQAHGATQDPLNAAQLARVHSPDPGHGHGFGAAVAIDGDTAFVGEPWKDLQLPDGGAVHVFARVGDDWIVQQELVASDPGWGDLFGVSIALSGDRAAIGAGGAATNLGSVYIFERIAGQWNEVAKIAPRIVDNFGRVVALDGDTLVVGVPSAYLNQMPHAGLASVFEFDGFAWNPTQELTAPDLQAHGQFGGSLAIDGDRLAIGSSRRNAPENQRGAVYTYTRAGSVWMPDSSSPDGLVAPDGGEHDTFGSSVALDAGVLAVGAPQDEPFGPGSGSAYLFTDAGGSWTFQQKLTAGPNGMAQARFGSNLALEDTTLVVASQYEDSCASQSGAVHLFRQESGTWVPQGRVKAADPGVGDALGESMGLSGGSFVLGTRFDDDQFLASGSAYLFELSEASFQRIGAGDGAAAPCPCSNESCMLAGTGCNNSTGRGGSLMAFGSDSAIQDDVRFVGWNLLPSQATLLISSAPNVGQPAQLGAGLLVGSAPFVRRAVTVPDALGRAQWGPGLAGSQPWIPGETLVFQAWYRDIDNNPCTGETSNLTNGIEVTFE